VKKLVICICLLLPVLAFASDAGIPYPPGTTDSIADAGVSAAGSAAPVASPSAAPALPDPVASPVESVSFVVKLWKTGTMPAAIIVGLFLLLTALSRKVTWLQKGYAAIATASLLGGCSMLIERAAAGTTPNAAMFASALVTAFALALKPTKAAEAK
jgi:hypothetical protein